MKMIEATYHIVTPMFIGGANHDPSDGIRPPSFKGALRFWWRALNWGRFYQEKPGDEAAALRALHSEECRLFGRAAKTENGHQVGGQGVFLLSVTKQPVLESLVSDWPNGHTARGEQSKSGYLGLGLFPMGEHKRRKAIKEGQSFTVTFTWKPNTKDEDQQSILDACKALGLFGGLGSRSRKAFGSIAIERLAEHNFHYETLEAYTASCKKLLQANMDYLPPYSAISPWIKFALGQQKNDARGAHSALANVYLNTRGQGGEVKGRSKLAFGLPLKGYDEKRRASPVMMHIHPVGQKFVSACLFLPADFHYEYEQGGSLDFYQGVTRFMNKLQEVTL